LNVDDLRDLMIRHQLVVLRGFQTFETSSEFSDYCSLWGEISVWPFGKVLELIEQIKPDDHIFDHNYVPLHWDGMYRPQVPELQIFHCASAPGAQDGGRTTFSNTSLLLKRAPQELIDEWSNVIGHYHRKMEFYDSKTIAPIVTEHPYRPFSVIRYCEPPHRGDDTFLNHPELEFKGARDLDAFHDQLTHGLYDSRNFYAHQWQTGDVVISDNYTLLHGREAFTSGAPRYLRRVHILGRPALDNPHLVSHQ
jgi:L-tyrosine isonitrile desaturase/decarboxylase